MEESFTEDLLRNYSMRKYTDEEIDYIKNFKYEGKTADEWIDRVKDCKELDEFGNPVWYICQVNAETALELARLKFEPKDDEY